MHIQPNQPLSFSHIGQRSVNQDALHPVAGTAGETSSLFIVCDGMGGADKGEVASQLLRDAVLRYVEALDYPMLDGVHLRAALALAYDDYRTYLSRHPFVNRMGSTLALLQFHAQGATVAHIGDSRVYQFRSGKILFRTQDHKQVNDLVGAGIITATQALTHPWRHRLSRAVVAGRGIESAAAVVPDVTLLTDVRAGDCFLLCSDGVQEQLNDAALVTLLTDSGSDQARLNALLTRCADQTKDNYSGCLLSIRSVHQTEPVRPAVFVVSA